jgi:hypothetical protein
MITTCTISDEVRCVGTVRCLARASPSAVPPTPISPPLAGAEQANTREVYGRILRRVAAGFGEDIAPDAASAWG